MRGGTVVALGDWCDMCADVGVGVGRFGGRKGVRKMVASVHGLPQLPSPRHLLGFAWLHPVSAPGSPSGVACPPAAISPGYCCPNLFVIDRSRGCLCDSGITWRFPGSDAAAGDGLQGCGGRGSGGVVVGLRQGEMEVG